MHREDKNLGFWDSVASTPSEHVKAIIIKGRKTQDAVNTTYQKKLLTEKFGMCGMGWGWTALDYSIKEATDYSGTIHNVLVLDTRFFYVIDKKKYTIPITVCKPFEPRGEIHKKLRTMALSKAISDLGFSADVFFGLFDDAEYVQDKKIEAYWEKLGKLSKVDLTAKYNALSEEKKNTPEVKEGFKKLFEAFKK